MLKKRIFTALVLIPLVLAILFFMPPTLFCLLTGLIVLAAAWEWSHLMEIKTFSRRILYVVLVLFMAFYMLFLPAPLILFAAFIWWLLATLLVLIYPRAAIVWGQGVFVRGCMGLFVLLPCWVAINFIRNQGDGVYTLLFLFVLIWSADSAAYFVGKKWGTKKLAAEVSPGKSWQGVAGGVLFSMLLVLLMLWVCAVPVNMWLLAILLSFVTVLFSIVGDLFESMLKRRAGVKDSGGLLPGHGGLLDRIDSLTAAAPVFAFGMIVLNGLWNG